jgi:hypothetical protein
MHYIKSSTDPRLYPPIARTSSQFQQLMNQRSAPERYNAVIDSYRLERACRNADYGLIRLAFVGIVEHALIRYLEQVKQICVDELFERTLNQIFACQEFQDTS